MQQIADQVGVHVTTVSRAVDDKWVQTPRGIFPLKRFFGGGTHTATGEEVAWETIKQKLLEIIAKEDKANPLSDEELVDEARRGRLSRRPAHGDEVPQDARTSRRRGSGRCGRSEAAPNRRDRLKDTGLTNASLLHYRPYQGPFHGPGWVVWPIGASPSGCCSAASFFGYSTPSRFLSFSCFSLAASCLIGLNPKSRQSRCA